jgi:hypothetical protein
MKKNCCKRTFALLLVALLALAFGGTLFAQTSYVDVGINVPFYWGVGDTVSNDSEFSGAIDYVFPVPDIKYGLMFGDGPVKFGVGARFFTVILESLIYPQLMVRGEFDPLVFTGSIGGGVFLFFGLWNNISTGDVYLSEVTAAYKVNDWFQLGLGTTVGLVTLNTQDFNAGYIYIPYIFGRFALGGEK